MLADKVHLSAPYLSKFFDQQFGMTFLSYLTQIRLDHAVNALSATEKTIDDIASDSGFPNTHAFVQAFKKEYAAIQDTAAGGGQISRCSKEIIKHETATTGVRKQTVSTVLRWN